MNTVEFKLSSNLPEVLNPNEVNAYFEEFHQGNMYAREIIIKGNLKLIKYLISKYFKDTSYNEEELFSIGTIGLIKAVDTFNLNKKVKFATYASRCIYNEMLMYIRKQKNHSQNISMENTIIYSKEEEMSLKNTIKDDNVNIIEDYEAKEEYEIVRNIVESLPDDDKLIIMLYYGFIDNKPLTQSQIGKIIGIDQSFISRKITQILKEISIELEKKEYIIPKIHKKEKEKKTHMI